MRLSILRSPNSVRAPFAILVSVGVKTRPVKAGTTVTVVVDMTDPMTFVAVNS